MENKPKTKWWQRLLKVVYVSIYVVAVFSATWLLYDAHKPTEVVDKYKSYVKCVKEKEVYYFYNNANLYTYSWTPNELSLSGQQVAQVLCGGFGSYIVHIETETEGTWREFVKYEALALTIIYISMYLIRSTLKYVIFGESFKKPRLIESIEKKFLP
jgi:hypothetical protein